MSKVWFTADTHFGHKRTLELSRRPFNDIEEMDISILDNWNSVVGDNDIVWHLGDFGRYEVTKLLKGKINLVIGNYECDEITGGTLTESQLRAFGFNEIYFSKSILRDFDGSKISLCHEPSNMNDDYFNLFGHIHKLQMVRRNGLNVGVDCHDFAPIDLETVLFYKNAIQNHYDEEVFGK